MWVVIENAVGRAHRHLAVALGSKTRPKRGANCAMRPKVVDLPDSPVAGEGQSGRRVFINGALRACDKSRLIEVAHPAEGMFHRQVRLPAHAAVDRQPLIQLPRILRVNADVILPLVVEDRIALNETAAQNAR